MKKKFRLVASLLFIIIGFTGCTSTPQSKQTRAIVEEIKSVSEGKSALAHLKYGGIKKQVEEQYKEGEEKATYKISLDRLDLSTVPAKEITVEEPEYDINTTSLEQHQKQYLKKIKAALNDYLEEAKDIERVKQDIKISVQKSNDEWKASITPAEIAVVISDIDKEIEAKAQEVMETRDGYLKLEHVEEMREQLLAAVEDKSFVEAVHIEDIQGNAKDGYSVTLSYPDPNEVYEKAVNTSYEAFKASDDLNTKEFELSELTSEMRKDIEEAVKSTDKKLTTTYKDDSSEFVKEIADVRQKALAEHLQKVNDEFITPVVEKPATSILSGGNTGQNIKISNTTDLLLFGDAYIAFYKIPGTDLEEEGTLALTAFIRAGETLNVRLPIGNYKLVEERGVTWYGAEVRYGPLGVSQTSKTLFDIRGNYTYTLEL